MLHSMPLLAEKIVGICLGCVIVMLLSVWQVAAQGSIQGSIRQADKGIPDHRIMLIRFGPNRDIQRIPGQTDTQGHFTFEQLETGEQFEYVVGIRYEGQLYRSEPVVLHSDEQKAGVILNVGTGAVSQADAGTEQPLPLELSSHHIVIVPQGDEVRIREILKILNTASSAYVGKMMPHTGENISLRLPLPPEHRDLRDVQGLSSEHLHYHTSGLYYTAPLTPGEHHIAYTYSLPLHDGTALLLTERFLPTPILEVLVEDKDVVVASDLQFAGHVSLDSHVFAHFQGTNLPVTSRSWVQFTVRRAVPTALTIAAYAWVVGLALAGIVTPFVSLWRQRAVKGQADFTEGQKPVGEASQIHILHNIAQLDRQREAGIIDAAFHHQQRNIYKQQLSILMQQQHLGILAGDNAVQGRSL